MIQIIIRVKKKGYEAHVKGNKHQGVISNDQWEDFKKDVLDSIEWHVREEMVVEIGSLDLKLSGNNNVVSD